MSVNCFCADDCASAEMYLSPAAAIAPLMAASSVFHRSSWKFDQETPMTLPLATATPAKHNGKTASTSKAAANLLMYSSLCRDRHHARALRYNGFFAPRAAVSISELPLFRIAPLAPGRACIDQTCSRSSPS